MLDFDQRAQGWDEEPRRVLMAQRVAMAIQTNVPLSLEWTAMEYGCGTGLVGFLLQPLLKKITMADSSVGMLQVLQQKILSLGVQNMAPVKLDLTTDPALADRYDLIFTSMTLHHVDDTRDILQKFFNLLNKNGYLCVADLDSEDGSFHGAEFSGHKGFDRTDLQEKLQQCGFNKINFYDAHLVAKKTEQGVKDFSMFLVKAQK